MGRRDAAAGDGGAGRSRFGVARRISGGGGGGGGHWLALAAAYLIGRRLRRRRRLVRRLRVGGAVVGPPLPPAPAINYRLFTALSIVNQVGDPILRRTLQVKSVPGFFFTGFFHWNRIGAIST